MSKRVGKAARWAEKERPGGGLRGPGLADVDMEAYRPGIRAAGGVEDAPSACAPDDCRLLVVHPHAGWNASLSTLSQASWWLWSDQTGTALRDQESRISKDYRSWHTPANHTPGKCAQSACAWAPGGASSRRRARHGGGGQRFRTWRCSVRRPSGQSCSATRWVCSSATLDGDHSPRA